MYLNVCILQMIERQYSTGFRFETREFYFASAGDNKLFISIERDIPKGWFAILEDSEVAVSLNVILSFLHFIMIAARGWAGWVLDHTQTCTQVG